MLNNILKVADKAGEIILRHFNSELAIAIKNDGSSVTAADIAANRYIVGELSSLTPSIPIISEESEIPSYEERTKWNQFWLIDPLDGTTEFINRLEDFTVNIALIDRGEPVLGVIYAPAKSTMYFAEKGKGAWRTRDRETSRIQSREPDKKGSLVVAGSRRHGIAELKSFLKGRTVEKIISIGSSLKFCLVAEGSADIYPRFGPTMEWDVAAGDCIYRNSAPSGLRRTELQYNKQDLRNGNFIIGITPSS